MIDIKLLLFIALIHFLADFGLQTHEQASNKSSSIRALLQHVGVYSGVWLIASCIIFDNIFQIILFAGFTFGFHFLTDYVTSRISKGFFDKQDYHNGFVVVGFDQLLHYIQLVGLYILCNGYL